MRKTIPLFIFVLFTGALLETTARSAEVTPDVTLRQDMRKLWTDHVAWTRDYIIAAIGDQPDLNAATDRLMANQVQIGNAVAARGESVPEQGM